MYDSGESQEGNSNRTRLMGGQAGRDSVTSVGSDYYEHMEEDTETENISLWTRTWHLVANNWGAILLTYLVMGGLIVLSQTYDGMAWEGYVAIASTYVAIFLLVKNFPPDVVLLTCSMFFVACGIIEMEQALEGFSDSGVVTIGFLFVVSAGIQDTGALEIALRKVLGSPTKVWVAQLRMMIPVAVLSAFLNNTPLVAMMIPIVENWAQRCSIPGSLLLLPLSYASMLGGQCTLIGSSTNLVAVGQAKISDPKIADEISMFSLAQVGLPLTLSGIAYICLATKLLPQKSAATTEFANSPMLTPRNPPQLEVVHETSDTPRSLRRKSSRMYSMEFKVEEGSVLVGESIDESGIDRVQGVDVVGIEGHDEERGADNQRLQAGDIVRIAGITSGLKALRQIPGLVPATSQVSRLGEKRRHRRLVEVVIDRHSDMVGRTVRNVQFRRRFNAAIVAVRKSSQDVVWNSIADMVIEAGDTLLVECFPNFVRNYQHSRQFALVSEVEGSKPPRHTTGKDLFRKVMAVTLLLTMVVISAVDLMNLAVVACFVSFGMVAMKCITVEEGIKAVNGRVLLTIASAFGVGAGISESGAAETIANGLVNLAQPLGSTGLLCALYLVTVLLSAVVSNNATIVLMFPIAQSASEQLDIPIIATVYTLMYAASASFSTPIGYQTNLMVYGPGGYTFADFFKFGVPLQVVQLVITILLVQSFYG